MESALFTVNPKSYSRIAVVGDLHGDCRSLNSIIELVNLEFDLLVFLGDYADRGPDGVEVIRIVAKLQKEHPKNVVPLMGNHEDYTEDGYPKFNPCTLIVEAENKVKNWDCYFQTEFKPFISALHLCVLVPNNALLVHGGVSSKIKSLKDLQKPSDKLRIDLLWSDPTEGKGEERNWMRGVGVAWGADVSETVCNAIGVKRIIRSHQPQLAESGPFVSHGGKVITVNATEVYGGLPFVYFIDPLSTKKDYYKAV